MRKEKKKKKVRKYAIVKTLDPWNRTGEKRKPGEGRSTVETTNRRIQRGSHDRVRKKKKKEKKRNLAAIGEQMNALVRAIPSLSHRLYPRIPLSSLDIIHPGREWRVTMRRRGERSFSFFFPPPPPSLFYFTWRADYAPRGTSEDTREDEVRDVDDDDENDGNDNGQREEKRAWPDKETNF